MREAIALLNRVIGPGAASMAAPTFFRSLVSLAAGSALAGWSRAPWRS